MKRILILFVVLSMSLMTAIPVSGQVDFQSCDPVGDSIVVAQMRRRMDYVRRERPAVALVLSGGGAKGAAHVGAIRYIEQMGIPVDMVLGTSMGGLVGGLYSVGYSPDDLDELLSSLDWSLILSDKIPQEFISYQQKKYKEKYILSIPFFYPKDNSLINNRSEDMFPEDDGHLHLGANDEFADKTLKQNLFGSLPSGYIFGHNVNNVFSSLTVGYQDDIDFADLPIPFFCVAAEMVSGKAKLWHSGKINTALRSTMSIPGIFAPVRMDGMILVDGGMRNNYPTDIAKAMGADIVIGVELSDDDMTYSDINNIADMAWQVVDILGRESFEKNVDIPDVTIKPELDGFNMMSFDSGSISTIIDRGYEAAVAVTDELAALKERLGPDVTEYHNQPAINIENVPVVVSCVLIDGVNHEEMDYLLGKIDIQPYELVTKSDIEEAVATIYATRSFDYVNYELLKDGDAYLLNIKCKKGPVHQVGVGARFDSETMVSAIANLGFNVHRVEGSALDITAKVATNPYLDVLYTYRFPKLPTFNLDVSGGYTEVNLNDFGPASRINFSYRRMTEKLYFSDLNWKKANLQIGIRNDYFNVTSLLAESFIPEEYDVKNLKNDFVTAYLNALSDNYDDGYFPSRGHRLGLSYNYVLGSDRQGTGGQHILSLEAQKVFNFGKSLAFIPSFRSRMIVGENTPFALMNLAGGSMAGRYLDQQIPFIGVSYATPLEGKMLMAGADFRIHLSSNNYLSLKANVAKDSDDFDLNLLWKGYFLFGCGIEYAYDSILGPIKADLHWSNLTESVGFYLSMGFDF